MSAGSAATSEPCVLRGEVVNLPKSAIIQEHVFRNIFSDNTWKNVLDEESRKQLRKFLPSGSEKEQDSAVHKLFTFQNIKFGNPLRRFQRSMKRNHYNPENYYYRLLKRKALYKAYKQRMLVHHTSSLENLILLRQQYMSEAQGLSEHEIDTKLNKKWKGMARQCLNPNNRTSDVDEKASAMYRKVKAAIRKHCDDGYGSSSDEESSMIIKKKKTEVDIQALLVNHKRRRSHREIAPTLDTRNVSISDIIDRALNHKTDSDEEVESTPASTSTSQPSSKKAKLAKTSTQTSVSSADKKGKVSSRLSQDMMSGVAPGTSLLTAASSQQQHNINVLFVLKNVMTSSKSLSDIMSSTEIANKMNEATKDLIGQCGWASAISDWASHITDLLNVLSDTSEGLQLISHTPSGEWQWVGSGRDTRHHLNQEWNRVIEASPSLSLILGDVSLTSANADADDQPAESKHGDDFLTQEALRFSQPHRCFTYKLDGKEYLVPPVKGVYEKVSQNSNNKAREHALLINDRPSYVTILTLVRDAAARLPNGEGTRYEICDLLKQSQFVSEKAPDNHINTVVSGALDRLHYEKDPCVKYDQTRKVWVYLHGNRTAAELESNHEAQGAAQKAKKAAKPSKALQDAQAAIVAASTHATQVEKVKVEIPDSETDSATRNLLGTEMTQPVPVASAQLLSPAAIASAPDLSSGLPAGVQVARKIAVPRQISNELLAGKQTVVTTREQLQAAAQQGQITPTLIQASSLPKGTVFYQRIATPQGKPQVMQKILTGATTTGSKVNQGGVAPSVTHRIMGSPVGTPVLARLIQTPAGQKAVSAGASGTQQFTHVQLQGGKQVAIPVAVGSGNRPVHILTAASQAGAKSAQSVTGSSPLRFTSISQQLALGATGVVSSHKSSDNGALSLLSGKVTVADGTSVPSNQVQLVKAIISSNDNKPGASQAYILTSSGNSSTSGATVARTIGQTAMLARVLNADGTLTAVNPSLQGSRSILSTAIKKPVLANPLSVGTAAANQMQNLQSFITSAGQIPKKIEKSELSPSEDLDIE